MTKPLIAEKPYPTTEGISPDCRALRVISPAYASSAGELNSILQYNYHALFFSRKGMREYADLLDSVAQAEMIHLKLLGQTILALGAPPVYTAYPPAGFNYYSAKFVAYSRSLKNMLEDDVIAERHAVSAYTRMLTLLPEGGARAVVARILEDEKLHLAAFEGLLQKYARGQTD